jgi:selenocysteine lyase/cysteine desulfurase
VSLATERFEVPGPGPYLLAHSVGCLPASARARLDEALFAPWAARGSDAWDSWLAAVDGFRQSLARLIGANPTQICPQPGVSAALSNLLSGLPREQGRDILLASAHAFPSIGFAMAAFERLGYRLRLLDGDPADPAVWRDAITSRVAAVVAMHVHSNSGRLSPIADIVTAARASGAVAIIDIAQSAGILPVDVARWGADAVIGSCVKWLCGCSGAGFLWASRDLLAKAEPLAVGWFSHEDPFAFDIADFRFAPDARRFWGGTPSIAPYAIATAGIDTILSLGPPEILAHNRRLVAIMAEQADAAFDMDARGGTLCLAARDTGALAATLVETGCRFDRRGEVLRLSFHAWNSEEEAARVGALAKEFGVRLV